MKLSKLFLYVLMTGFLLSFTKTDYLEWSDKRRLNLKDFKAKIPKDRGGKVVNLSALISYEIKQPHNGIPQIKIFNYIDREKSWILDKKEGVLMAQQIKFDQCELAVRKIRAIMDEMNKEKVKDQDKYVEVLTRMATETYNRVGSQVMLEDQPYLLKIMQKDISDSLNLYKEFAK